MAIFWLILAKKKSKMAYSSHFEYNTYTHQEEYMFAKWSFALFLFWLVAGKASTPAEYQNPIPGKTLDPTLVLFAIPGTNLDSAQIEIQQQVYAGLAKLEGSETSGLSWSIRHEGTSIDLLVPISPGRDYNLLWTLSWLAAQRKLIYELEVDDDGSFWHVTPFPSNANPD
jgi:hypothetical protein